MRTFSSNLCKALCLSGLLFATGLRADVVASTNAALWFPIGEELFYTVYWGVIPVGLSHITTEWIEEDGRKLLAIRFKTRTSHVIETLYPVDDLIESIVDPETFLPIRFTKKLSEGRYRCDEVTEFDHKKLKAVQVARPNGKPKEFDIESDTRDIVSFMYFMRQNPLKAGNEYKYRVMADEKLYDVFVKAQKDEPVNVGGYGKVDSVKMEPEASFGGIFVRKGRIWLWVSNDPRCLITKVAAKVPFANINVVLKQVLGPGDDFWIKKAKAAVVEKEEEQDDDPY